MSAATKVYEFGKDEDGSLTCPIPGCNAPLYLSRTYSVPLWHPEGLPTDQREAYDAPVADAVSDGWQVECSEGHTIDGNDNVNDWHEPFKLGWLVATGHGQPPICDMCSEPFDVGEEQRVVHDRNHNADHIHVRCVVRYEEAMGRAR